MVELRESTSTYKEENFKKLLRSMRKLLLLSILLTNILKCYSQDSMAIKRIDSLAKLIDEQKAISKTLACGEIKDFRNRSIGSLSEEITSHSANKTLLKVNRWEEWKTYTKEITFYFNEGKLIKVTASIHNYKKLETSGNYYYDDEKSFYEKIWINKKPTIEIRNVNFLKYASAYLSDYQK